MERPELRRCRGDEFLEFLKKVKPNAMEEVAVAQIEVKKPG